jgi:hypothetical protein
LSDHGALRQDVAMQTAVGVDREVASASIRIENRLMRFKLTDSNNPLLMPTFNFTCNDSSLTLVAIKVYLPFASDTEWTYLKFQ